jgi:hypothetical protein
LPTQGLSHKQTRHKRVVAQSNHEKMNKDKLIKIIGTMVRKVLWHCMMAAMLLGAMLLCAPCILIFSTGNDGELTIWNAAGLLWCCILYMVFKKFS